MSTHTTAHTLRTPDHAGARRLTDETFRTEIEQGPGIALVDFGADWCPPCRLMAPILDELASEYAGRATVATVDVDADVQTASRYHVRSLPTFLFFRDGQVVDRIVGAVPRTRLSERLEALLLDRATGPASRNG